MCCKGEARTEGSGRGHHLARMDSGFGWMVHSPADSFESVVVEVVACGWWVGGGKWEVGNGGCRKAKELCLAREIKQ